MICNKIYSVTQFNLSNIKYIPAKDLAKIQKFISLSYQRTRTITDRDSFDYKYDSWSATSLFDTLRPSSSWSNVTLDTSGMDRLYIFANVTMYHDFTMNWTPVFKDIYAAIFDFTEEWTDELYNLANVTLPEGTGAFYNYLPKS
jgi:hypothetical protein